MTVPVCIETPTKFARYTVMDSIAVPLSTIMKLSGANTAVANDGNGDVFAGIAWEEKTANDGITQISTAIDGVWDMTADATISEGAMVCLSGANLIRAAVAADLLTGATLGKCLEAGTKGSAARVRLGLN